MRFLMVRDALRAPHHEGAHRSHQAAIAFSAVAAEA